MQTGSSNVCACAADRSVSCFLLQFIPSWLVSLRRATLYTRADLQVWPCDSCILVLHGNRLKENWAFISVLHIKLLNEITDMISRIMRMNSAVFHFPRIQLQHWKCMRRTLALYQHPSTRIQWGQFGLHIHSVLNFLLNLLTKGGNYNSSFKKKVIYLLTSGQDPTTSQILEKPPNVTDFYSCT